VCGCVHVCVSVRACVFCVCVCVCESVFMSEHTQFSVTHDTLHVALLRLT